MNTQRHNQRKRDRGKRNLFWLVKSTMIGSRSLMLYNRKPYKEDISYNEYASEYKDKSIWFSVHSEFYLKNDAIDKFPNASQDNQIPVKLVVDKDNPDMFIQRRKDNLYMDSKIHKYWKGTNPNYEEVSCYSRISNKLFPEITEDDGIVGVRIEEIRL